jgi:hypothetical protein
MLNTQDAQKYHKVEAGFLIFALKPDLVHATFQTADGTRRSTLLEGRTTGSHRSDSLRLLPPPCAASRSGAADRVSFLMRPRSLVAHRSFEDGSIGQKLRVKTFDSAAAYKKLKEDSK